MLKNWQLKYYQNVFYSPQILLKHRNVLFILLIYLFLSHINTLQIFLRFRKPICFSKSVITTFIISNIIFLASLLLNMCVKVPRGRNLRKQDNGNGVIELCYLTFPFCLPKSKSTWHTVENEWMNEWLNEQYQTEKNKTKCVESGKMSYSLNNHCN